MREQRYRQAPEEILEARRDGRDVVEFVQILQVKLFAPFKILRNQFRLTHSSGLAIDALIVHPWNEQDRHTIRSDLIVSATAAYSP